MQRWPLSVVGAAFLTLAASGVARSTAEMAPAPCGATAGNARNAASDASDNTLSWSESGRRFDLRYRGAVTLADDDGDVVSLSPGGWLTVAEEDTRAELRACPDGSIERRFWSADDEHAWMPAGNAWWSEALPRIVRRSGFAGPQRVARILKARGTRGVLDEIQQLKTDSVRGQYFRSLLAQIDLDADLQQVLDAMSSIRSSVELASIISSIVDEAARSPQTLAPVLRAAARIDSDAELGRLLASIGRRPVDGEARDAYFETLASIQSDAEVGRVLVATSGSALDPTTLAAALKATRGMRSSAEIARVLTAMAARHPIEGMLRDAYLEAAARISSSMERRRALAALDTRKRERN